MSTCEHLLCARYSYEGKIKKAYRYKVSRRFRWQRLLRFRKGFPEEEDLAGKRRTWQGGYRGDKDGIGRQKAHVQRYRDRTWSRTWLGSTWMSPSLGVFVSFFCSDICACEGGMRSFSSCFCKTKSLPKESCSWNANEHRGIWRLVVFFSSVHLFLMSNAIPSSPEVLLTRRVIEHNKT